MKCIECSAELSALELEDYFSDELTPAPIDIDDDDEPICAACVDLIREKYPRPLLH